MDLLDLSLIDWLEVTWLVASSITLAATAANWHEACMDWNGVKAKGLNGLLKMWSHGSLVLAVSLVSKSILAVAAGVVVLILPNPVGPPELFGLSGLVRVLLIGINLLMMAQAIWLMSLRKRMISYRDRSVAPTPGGWDGVEKRKVGGSDGH